MAQVLLGETPAELGHVQASELGTDVMHEVAKVQSKYWKNVNAAACAPPDVGTEVDDYTTPVGDILKEYRVRHMWIQHRLYPMPIANEDLDEVFHNQILLSEGPWPAKSDTLVVFAHDFGNLRVETDGVASTDVNLANSYLLDTSDTVVNWVKQKGWKIIDVNVLRSLRTQFAKGPRMVSNNGDKLDGNLMRYLWDNFIE